jgi:hypothetical protein
MITGAEPDAIKVARPVLNGEDEETGRKALHLVLTQLPRSRFQPRLSRSVRCFGKAKTLYQQRGKLL